MGLLDNNKSKPQAIISNTIVADLSDTGAILTLDNTENNKCLMLYIAAMDGTPSIWAMGYAQSGNGKLPMYKVTDGSIVGGYLTSKGLYAIDITGCNKVYLRNETAVANLTSVNIVYSLTNELPLFTSQRRPIQEIASLKGNKATMALYNLNTLDFKYIYVAMTSRNASGGKVAIDGYVETYSPTNDVRKTIAEFSNKSEYIGAWVENTPIGTGEGFIANITSTIPSNTTITIQVFGVR